MHGTLTPMARAASDFKHWVNFRWLEHKRRLNHWIKNFVSNTCDCLWWNTTANRRREFGDLFKTALFSFLVFMQFSSSPTFVATYDVSHNCKIRINDSENNLGDGTITRFNLQLLSLPSAVADTSPLKARYSYCHVNVNMQIRTFQNVNSKKLSHSPIHALHILRFITCVYGAENNYSQL